MMEQEVAIKVCPFCVAGQQGCSGAPRHTHSARTHNLYAAVALSLCVRTEDKLHLG